MGGRRCGVALQLRRHIIGQFDFPVLPPIEQPPRQVRPEDAMVGEGEPFRDTLRDELVRFGEFCQIRGESAIILRLVRRLLVLCDGAPTHVAEVAYEHALIDGDAGDAPPWRRLLCQRLLACLPPAPGYVRDIEARQNVGTLKSIIKAVLIRL